MSAGKTAPGMKLSHPAKFIGTWFGIGLIPKAPGTFGSIAALPFAWFIQGYLGNIALLIAGINAFVVGWIACNAYLPYVDRKDPREMVIDEVSGQWILLAFMQHTLFAYCIGLALFRFFDIVKPWPVSVADKRIGGGFGVMFDDTVAALYPVLFFWLMHFVPGGHQITYWFDFSLL